MAKWSGYIGFTETVETKPSVWTPTTKEYFYYGDVIRNTRSHKSANQTNDNISTNNTISIIANPYATKNFHNMKYIIFMGTKWKITNVDVQYPRLILTMGDVYNGE